MACDAAMSSMLFKPVVQSHINAPSCTAARSPDPTRFSHRPLTSSSSLLSSSSSAATLAPSLQICPFSCRQPTEGFILGQRRRTANLRISAVVREHTGSILGAENLRFVVVAGRFNEVITKPLVAGALETFKKFAVKDEHIEVIWVPGSFEIPVTAQTLAKSGRYHAVVCIGAVVKGATTHYDAVANSAASGIMSASLNSGVPCIFGVLTCENMEQGLLFICIMAYSALRDLLLCLLRHSWSTWLHWGSICVYFHLLLLLMKTLGLHDWRGLYWPLTELVEKLEIKVEKLL